MGGAGLYLAVTQWPVFSNLCGLLVEGISYAHHIAQHIAEPYSGYNSLFDVSDTWVTGPIFSGEMQRFASEFIWVLMLTALCFINHTSTTAGESLRQNAFKGTRKKSHEVSCNQESDWQWIIWGQEWRDQESKHKGRPGEEMTKAVE